MLPTFTSLPNDIWKNILSYLDKKDLSSVHATCRFFRFLPSEKTSHLDSRSLMDKAYYPPQKKILADLKLGNVFCIGVFPNNNLLFSGLNDNDDADIFLLEQGTVKYRTVLALEDSLDEGDVIILSNDEILLHEKAENNKYQIILWNCVADTKEVIKEFDKATKCLFMLEKDKLVVGFKNGDMQIIDLVTRDCIQTLSATDKSTYHITSISEDCFISVGKVKLKSDYDYSPFYTHRLKIWRKDQSGQYEAIKSIDHSPTQAYVHTITALPNNRFAYDCQGKIYVYQLVNKNYQLMHTIPNAYKESHISSLKVLSTGQLISVETNLRNSHTYIYFRNLQDFSVEQKIEFPHQIHDLHLLNNGDLVMNDDSGKVFMWKFPHLKKNAQSNQKEEMSSVGKRL